MINLHKIDFIVFKKPSQINWRHGFAELFGVIVTSNRLTKGLKVGLEVCLLYEIIFFFCITSSWFSNGFLVMNGFWRDDGTPGILLTYMPHVLLLKNPFSIAIVEQFDEGILCIAEDFNLVREAGERSDSGSGINSKDIVEFNHFLNQCGLLDFPLCGRKFTYYREGGWFL